MGRQLDICYELNIGPQPGKACTVSIKASLNAYIWWWIIFSFSHFIGSCSMVVVGTEALDLSMPVTASASSDEESLSSAGFQITAMSLITRNYEKDRLSLVAGALCNQVTSNLSTYYKYM